MPTDNGLVLPHEIIDDQLKRAGVKGKIDATTGLLLPPTKKSRVLVAREIHAEHDTSTQARRQTWAHILSTLRTIPEHRA